MRPSQVYLTAPRITGSLTAVFPADSGEDPQYTGTANSLYDIEQTRRGAELYARSRFSAIPVLFIGDEAVVGFNPDQVTALLGFKNDVLLEKI